MTDHPSGTGTSSIGGRHPFPRDLMELFGDGADAAAGITRVLLENTSDIIHVLDGEARIRFVSASVERILGYPPKELVGRVGHEIVHPDDQAYAQRTFAESIDRTGATRQMELRLRHREGHWCTFEVRARIIGVSASGPIAIVTSHEITDRKRAERELHQAGEMLQAVVQASPLPILMLDTAGCLRMWNRAAERVFGWTADEVLGQEPPSVPPETEEEYRRLREQALRGDVLESVETVRQRRSGDTFPVSIFTAPVRDAAGTVIGTMAVEEDITERKRYEEQRAQVLQFVSHDLRSPLSGILFAATHAQALAGASEEPGEIPRLLAGVIRSAESMNVLIRDLVDASRIEAGGFLLSPETCMVDALVQEAVAMGLPLARERGISLEGSVRPELSVRADRHRMLQVLSNLITNALRFTAEGGRVLVGADEVDGEVRLSVSDTGCGIAEEDLPHVFERFWQRNAYTRGSAGLGLTIARGITEAHGGRIWVETAVGEGSKFHVALPNRDADAHGEADSGV